MKKLILSFSLFACLSFTALASNEQPIEDWKIEKIMTPECDEYGVAEAQQFCEDNDLPCNSTDSKYAQYVSYFTSVCNSQ